MWTVTRQHRWHDGEYTVEISEGGIDYSGPDALCKKYPGEFEEFSDPREAVEAALRIAKEWRKVEKRVKMVMGANLDMCVGDPVAISVAERSFKKVAKKLWEAAPKCDRCGEILPERAFKMVDFDGEFCSENCAERAWEFEMESQQEMEDE